MILQKMKIPQVIPQICTLNKKAAEPACLKSKEDPKKSGIHTTICSHVNLAINQPSLCWGKREIHFSEGNLISQISA